MSQPHDKKSRKHKHHSSDSDSPTILTKKVETLENKLKENKERDKQVEHKLEHKLDKLETKVHKKELKYRTIIHRLRREKCLMVNGADSYGSFYSTQSQTIHPNDTVKMDKKVNVLNLKLKSNGKGIKVLREGIYIVHIVAQFNEPSQVALFINNDPELSTVTSSNNVNNTVVIHQLVKLYEDDIVSFKNYLSATDLTTSTPTSSLIPCSVNVELTLWKLAPLPEKHCLPPRLNENPWCYSESDSTDC
jgi:hypothetical protein